MSAPSLHIVLELEAAPRVYCDWLRESDELRMADWLDAHPDHRELIDRALEIAAEERAA
jgi:hypothetical protein